MTAIAQNDTQRSSHTPNTLRSPYELFWVSHYNYFLSKGYKLRSRYKPDWVPSWGLRPYNPEDDKFAEDALRILSLCVMDATCLRDKKQVVIKRVSVEEASIGMWLSAQEPGSKENRTVPLHDVFPLPMSDGEVFIVMPMFQRYDRLPFRRMGEFAEATHQFLQGLNFMHRHNVAHRDACRLNMHMDSTKMIPKGFHFAQPNTHQGKLFSKFSWKSRWAVRPVQYFFIDFGLSSRYPPGSKNIEDIGIVGQDSTVPEQSLENPYDPFKMDVYQLGNALKKTASTYNGLEPFMDLFDAMTRPDPATRPTALESLELFERLMKQWTPLDFKCRVWLKDTPQKLRSRIQYWGRNPHYA